MQTKFKLINKILSGVYKGTAEAVSKKYMQKTIVKYEVIFTPKVITEIFNIMSKCDLGISGGEMPTTFIYSWSTTEKVDSAYLRKMRKAIKKGLEAQGITQIHSLKRLK